MKCNSNRLWFIFIRTWEVVKRKKDRAFFCKQKIGHHCVMGTKMMRMNFIGLMIILLQKLPEK